MEWLYITPSFCVGAHTLILFFFFSRKHQILNFKKSFLTTAIEVFLLKSEYWQLPAYKQLDSVRKARLYDLFTWNTSQVNVCLKRYANEHLFQKL